MRINTSYECIFNKSVIFCQGCWCEPFDKTLLLLNIRGIGISLKLNFRKINLKVSNFQNWSLHSFYN